MAEVEIKQENLVYGKSPLLTDNVMHYCPGCSHGTVHKLVAGVPFYGVTKDGSKKTEAYFSFVQDGLITGPAQNEVTYKGDVYVFDGQNNIRAKTRYAMDQQLKGMMSWDLATDMPLNDSRSLFKTMVEELGR